jgi:hypothetical protein
MSFMKITTVQTLKILYCVSCLLFTGICIEAGEVITNLVLVYYKPVVVSHLWNMIDMSSLYNFDRGYFYIEGILIFVVQVSKAYMFYLIMRVLDRRKFNLAQSFNKDVERFISRMAFMTFLIGVLSFWGDKYAEWFVKKGVTMPSVQTLNIGGADVWLFMCVTLYVIAQIYKRGMEIQVENDLTV